jgi:hypothetical protein
MTAAPSHTAITLAADTHAYLVQSGVMVASAGGNVMFVPQPSMPHEDRAAIAAQWISVLEKWRDASLAGVVPAQRSAS